MARTHGRAIAVGTRERPLTVLVGILELRHSFHEHTRLYLFSVFVMLTWVLWMLKVVLSWWYRPWKAPYRTTTTVVIPVVDEPLDLFRDVLTKIVAQEPSQIIVVINGARNPDLERVCAEFAPDVEWTWTAVAGKRNAVKIGVERAFGDVVLLVDSDTIWTDGTLAELVKPFADETIGGVTTRQRILDPRRNFLTRWADWLENSRALYSMPAQSVLGSVGCLPGRTIAFRRSVLDDVMTDFMTQTFLGIFLEVSDDRTLTNLTLKRGFRTVYQSTSLVYTDAPLRLKKLIKQQFRWARGSQYNTMRMLPWMLVHTPVLAFFFVLDIVLPFLLICSAIAWGIRSNSPQHAGADLYAGLLHVRSHALVAVLVLTVLTSTLAMCLRQARHIAEVPVDFFWMPFYILFSTLVLTPIRLYGFVRCGHLGSWGTRANAYNAAGDSPDAEPLIGTDTPAALSGEHAITATKARAVTQAADHTDGDPRGLVPYLIASAAIALGVWYDVRPF
jgi:hyaluronan synthase